MGLIFIHWDLPTKSWRNNSEILNEFSTNIENSTAWYDLGTIRENKFTFIIRKSDNISRTFVDWKMNISEFIPFKMKMNFPMIWG